MTPAKRRASRTVVGRPEFRPIPVKDFCTVSETVSLRSIALNQHLIEQPYPGSDMTADDTVKLALEYRKAAHALQTQKRRNDRMSHSPGRLCALHAIELFLNSVLLRHGLTTMEVRGMRHDFDARGQRAEACGLRLRKGTLKHLRDLNLHREYLTVRYDPTREATELTRILATLEELAKKACRSAGVELPAIDVNS